MRRISSPIAFLLLFVLPASDGMYDNKGQSLDRPQKYPSTLQEGQKVRVHYVDKNIKPLEGVVKKVTMEAVVVTHQCLKTKFGEIQKSHIHRSTRSR